MAADLLVPARLNAPGNTGTPGPADSGRDLERRARNINPGGWAIESQRPISTILGSCVAVCLYDPKLRLGGMNHFLLPSGNRRGLNDQDIVLHGDYAMEVLRNALFARGASDGRLVAKAFGGGNVLNAIKMAIGTRNAEFARQWLQREGIPLLAEDMGGTWSRKVVFDPLTGYAFCRRTAIQQPEAIANADAENAYEKSLLTGSKPSAGTEKKIELF
ncbi:chemotaxis protein CheD [Alcaligenaceae bacterium]|nr:chemotaxis protein CheD [Alcaligenaceae bacterium]